MEDKTGYNKNDEEAVKNAKDCNPNLFTRAVNWGVKHPVKALEIVTAILGGAAFVGHEVNGVIKKHTTIQATVANYSKHSHSKTSGIIRTGFFTSKQHNRYMKDVSDGMKPFDAMEKNGIRWK